MLASNEQIGSDWPPAGPHFRVQAYGIGVLAIGCSVFYGAVNLIGNRRLHTPIGVTASAAGLLIGSIVTWSMAARFLSMF